MSNQDDFPLKTHPSNFTLEATVTRTVKFNKSSFMIRNGYFTVEMFGKRFNLKSLKSSRKNLSEVVVYRWKVKGLEVGKNNKLFMFKILLPINTAMQQLLWNSGKCAIKVRITIHMYISKSLNTHRKERVFIV